MARLKSVSGPRIACASVLEANRLRGRDGLACLDADEMDDRVAEMAGRIDDETLVGHGLAAEVLLLEDGLRR